jgi:ArsR family transcriptional regulator, zinc-responsive transcriptional repressor
MCNIFLAHEKQKGHMAPPATSGDELLLKLSALASPHRLRIVAELKRGRNYVSQLARVVGLSRPLLQMHLAKLEAAGLVTSRLELSDDGKAMKFYELQPFTLTLTPEAILEAVATLRTDAAATGDKEE